MKMINSARLRHALLLALWAVGNALIAREASADGKLVPATVCQPLVQPSNSSQEDPDDVLDRIANIRYSFNGRVLNQSSTKRFGVVCPIVRDNLKRPLNWIRVMFVDNFPDPAVPSADEREVLECEVRAAAGLAETASDSQQCKSNTLDCPFDVDTGQGTGSGFWQFKELSNVESGDDANNPNFVYGFSHYTLTCRIPPRNRDGVFSWIAGIMIDEP